MRTLVIISTFFIFLVSCSFQQEAFYYNSGKKIAVKKFENKIAFRSSNPEDLLNDINAFVEKNKTNLILDESNTKVFSSYGIVVYDSPSEKVKSEFLNNLAGNAEELQMIRVEGGSYPAFARKVIRVRFKKEVSLEDMNAYLDKSKFKVIGERFDTLFERTLKLDPGKKDVFEAAEQIYESGLVDYAHPDLITRVIRNDQSSTDIDTCTFITEHENHKYMQTNEVWCEGNRGDSSIIIVIIDDAFYHQHNELKDNFRRGINILDPSRASDPSPSNINESHGTPVASVAIASADNHLKVIGTCPECSFIGIKSNVSVGEISDALRKLIISDEIDILSMSWSFNIINDDFKVALKEVDSLARNDKGAPIFYAIGSDNINGCHENSIASLDYVISIGGSNFKDEVSSSFSYGDCLDLIAPAARINAAFHEYGQDEPDALWPFAGTSAATPQVAGIAGLMIHNNTNLTSKEIQEILKATADKISSPAAPYNQEGFSLRGGFGRVNAYKAVMDASSNVNTNLSQVTSD